MPSVFRELQRASFDGIEFPISRCEVIGGLRDHVHEYPHSPGGAPEKLGRRLYTIRMSAVFDARLLGYNENLWPGDLADLRDRFEQQTTARLVIPTIGTIDAYCFNWSQLASSERQSGETAELEFREDQSKAFLFEGLVNVDLTGYQDAITEFDETLRPLMEGGTLQPNGTVTPPLVPAPTPRRALTKAEAFAMLRQRDADILQKISQGFVEALSFADRGELYATQVQAKALQVIAGCEQAYRTVEILKRPLMWRELRAMKRVWENARTLHDRAAGTANRILLYRTPAPMSVTDVSRALYGDTQRAVLLLKLNAFRDAFQIPRDTVVRYFDPETLRGEAA